MDTSITRITPEIRQDQGAQAYDDGKGIDDHSLTDAGDIKHFEFGWHSRRVERSSIPGDQSVAASVSGRELYEAWVAREVTIANPTRWEDLADSTQIYWNKQAIYRVTGNQAAKQETYEEALS